MDFTIRCPYCGARTTVEPADFERPGHLVCPSCQQQIPLHHGADAEPREPAD